MIIKRKMTDKALERDEKSSLTNQLVQLSGRVDLSIIKTEHVGLDQLGWRCTIQFLSTGEGSEKAGLRMAQPRRGCKEKALCIYVWSSRFL